MCSGRWRVSGIVQAADSGEATTAGRSEGRLWRRAAVVGLTVLVGLLPGFVAVSAAAEPVAEADIAVFDVSDRPDPVWVNQSVTYQVEVGNRGPSQATSVILTTSLPAGVRFDAAASDPACSAADTAVTCSFPFWDANAVGIVLIALVPADIGVLTQTFTVRASEQDPDPSNNTQTETTEVAEPTEADISINLPSTVPLVAGQPSWLSVMVGNAGPATATGITATLRFASASGITLGGGTCTDTRFEVRCVYSFGSLPPGTGSALPVPITATQPGSYTLRGIVTADQPDPNLDNNVDQVVVRVRAISDMSVQLAESADPAVPGMPLTYTATATNNGPSTAAGVMLTDTWETTFPGGAELLSVASSQGQCAPLPSGTGVDCQLGDLASGGVATVTVTLRPQGVGRVTDTAVVSSRWPDPDSTNNTAAETTQVGPVSLP